jgi:TonB family protein
MNGRFLPIGLHGALMFAGAIMWSMPARALQNEPSLAADSCVTTREDGAGGYLLANACDYPIEIAYCSEPKADSSLCIGRQDWNREQIAPRAQGQSRVQPDSALNLFACRTPGAVEILPSGMARCIAAAPAPVVPVMSAASLKNPAAVVTDADYPASNHHMEGTSRFELMVGPDGRPISCQPTTSSGYVQLDKAACNAFMRRARFSPAKDAAGSPTTGKYRGSVTWKAP